MTQNNSTDINTPGRKFRKPGPSTAETVLRSALEDVPLNHIDSPLARILVVMAANLTQNSSGSKIPDRVLFTLANTTQASFYRIKEKWGNNLTPLALDLSWSIVAGNVAEGLYDDPQNASKLWEDIWYMFRHVREATSCIAMGCIASGLFATRTETMRGVAEQRTRARMLKIVANDFVGLPQHGIENIVDDLINLIFGELWTRWKRDYTEIEGSQLINIFLRRYNARLEEEKIAGESSLLRSDEVGSRRLAAPSSRSPKDLGSLVNKAVLDVTSKKA